MVLQHFTLLSYKVKKTYCAGLFLCFLKIYLFMFDKYLYLRQVFKCLIIIYKNNEGFIFNEGDDQCREVNH